MEFPAVRGTGPGVPIISGVSTERKQQIKYTCTNTHTHTHTHTHFVKRATENRCRLWKAVVNAENRWMPKEAWKFSEKPHPECQEDIRLSARRHRSVAESRWMPKAA